MELRVPWRIERFAYLIYQHGRSCISRLRKKNKKGLKISFYCDYQQNTTGASIAIASIANHLSKQHYVEAIVKPYSGYSKILDLSVTQHLSSKNILGQIVFVDIEQKNAIVEKLIQEGKTVLLTCHAFPTHLHGVPQDQLINNLELCSYIHFVSESQRAKFIEHYPKINIEEKSFVISNYTRQSAKKSITSSVGIVGYLSRVDKNALAGIQLAQKTNASSIECWGSEEIYGLDEPDNFTKLHINGWADDLLKMHSSFDVLLSTSHYETFGLVVVEALSAGIPCVLSDIPVYRELYSGCKGVAFLTEDEKQNIDTINHFLDQKENLKEDILSFWNTTFSNETIEHKWFNTIKKISTM